MSFSLSYSVHEGVESLNVSGRLPPPIQLPYSPTKFTKMASAPMKLVKLATITAPAGR